MEALLGVVGNVTTIIGDVIDMMIENPMALIGVAVGLVGSGISLTQRLIGVRRGRRR